MIIYIYSDEIRVGKTTRLTEWCLKRKGVTGILSPVIDDKRHFVDIESGERRLMEAGQNDSSVQEIGRFVFSTEAFNWADNKLKEAAMQQPDLIVVDEVGPLELMNMGFSNTINSLLNNERNNILIVVRSGKLEEVLAHFNLNRFTVKVISDLEKEMAYF